MHASYFSNFELAHAMYQDEWKLQPGIIDLAALRAKFMREKVLDLAIRIEDKARSLGVDSLELGEAILHQIFTDRRGRNNE